MSTSCQKGKNKALANIKAFLPKDKMVGKIIELCDLYPVGKSWRKWTDNIGNFLQVYNNKKVTSFSQDPSEYDETIITDIYFKASPKKLSKISKWAFISFGKERTNFYNSLYIWFLGNDDRLRFCCFHNGGWLKNEPPLISGIDTLRPVLNNLSVNKYTQSDILHIKGPVAMNITKSWATQWPCDDGLIIEMSKCNEALTSVIREII